jgi:RND family efflux transporter MFP subunit
MYAICFFPTRIQNMTRTDFKLVPSLLCAIALLLASAGAHAADKAAPTRPALTVTSVKAVSSSLPMQLAANGNIAPWQEAIIGSESGGLRLAEVLVNVGDVVRKGDVLAVFSADTVNADVAQSQAALAEAQANAVEAISNARRARNLAESGALSEQETTRYLTAEGAAKARIKSATASLTSQKLRLKYTKVIAPDSGVISARSATVGSVVGVGVELFRMIRQGRLEWRAEVTAAELGRIKPGTKVRVKAANGSELMGRVRMIAPTVDLQTRTALVYVDLPASLSASAPFKAGMYASGQFDMGVSNAVTLPQQAVVIRDGFSYVFRLNADSRVSQIKVVTGRRLADRIEVVKGLSPDATIVVSGAGFLNDGDLVRNVAAQPAVAAR